MRIFAFAVVGAVAVASSALAHGPVRLKLELDKQLAASPDEVWAAIGKFEDMSWHPGVASTEIIGDGSVDQPEKSQRIVHLKGEGDPTISEILAKFQPEKRCYAYRIEQVETSVLPVTNYGSTICVQDEGGKAKVVWKGGFYRGDPNGQPADNLNDDAAIASVTAIYQAGLDALAERFGSAE